MSDRDWPDGALGDVASFEYGAALPALSRTGDEVPVFGSNGEVGRHRAALVKGPGIVVGRKGTVGALAWSEHDFWPIDTTYYVEVRPGIDKRWLYWAIATLGLNQLDSSTGVPGLNRNDAYRLRLAVPSEDRQRRIAGILDALDDQIRLTSRVIAKLEQVGRGLMGDLLSCGVDTAGRLRPAGSFETHISDAASFPASWTVVRLDQIAEVERGKFGHRPRNDPMYLNGPFPFIQTGDIAAVANGVILDASQSLSSLGAAVSRRFAAGTIAVTIAANIADTAMLGRPMYFPDSVVGVSVHEPHRAEYVQFVLRAAKPRLEARAPQSAQRNINLQDLRPLHVPLPDPAEQSRICRVMAAQAKVVAVERDALAKLLMKNAGLLDDLISGRVRVSQDAVS